LPQPRAIDPHGSSFDSIAPLMLFSLANFSCFFAPKKIFGDIPGVSAPLRVQEDG
jgi:hypothetical protein